MSGSIPVLAVRGVGLAEMWERSLIALWAEGSRVHTEYDARDSNGEYLNPPSVDATLLMTATDPGAEPAVHRCFPGGLEDLEEYRLEVLEGIKDHWVAGGTTWSYTYHSRLRQYRGVDQVAAMIDHLARSPITRRCQAVTWQVESDPQHDDPPCLQSIWCRCAPDAEGVLYLNMNVRFRSRDGYKAAFMNAYAFGGDRGLQGEMAREIMRRSGRAVRLGHYCDLSDSYHIYGKDHAQFEREFLVGLERRTFEERTWRTGDVLEIMLAAQPAIRRKVAEVDAEKG